MRHGAALLCLLLVGLPGLAYGLDRQGMGSIGFSFGGAGYLGAVPELSSGPRARLSLRAHSKYQLSTSLRATASVGYTWNTYKGQVDPSTNLTQDTLLVVNPIEVGLEYQFRPDYSASRPYAGVQMGFYRWQYVSNASYGARQVVHEKETGRDLDRACFTYGFNLGEEYYWRDNASVSLEFGLHRILADNSSYYQSTPMTTRFMSNLNLTELRLGMTYYFPVAAGSGKLTATPAAVVADTAAPIVPTTARPEIQKETIQITPDVVDDSHPAAKKAPATPAAPSSPSPAPVPPPAPEQPKSPPPAEAGPAPAAASPAPAAVPSAPAASDTSSTKK